MNQFKKIETEIEGLFIIEPTVRKDARGYFMEAFNKKDLWELGIEKDFVQDNESYSQKGVLRGLHRQKNHPQGKLVRVIRGEVYDVAVDGRMGSDTYGKWEGVYLSENNHRALYIPEDFYHGFLAITDGVILTYKCTDYYDPIGEDGIVYNDPKISINWPLDQVDYLILSQKDYNLPTLL